MGYITLILSGSLVTDPALDFIDGSGNHYSNISQDAENNYTYQSLVISETSIVANQFNTTELQANNINFTSDIYNILLSVNLPDDITSIGSNAFYGNHSLAFVNIPLSVTSIGPSAFMNCLALNNMIIPSSVTIISNQLFLGCAELLNATISNGVTHIEYSAFQDCPKLISIVIPDSCINIGDSAFHSCTNLAGIVIPDSVTTIAENAFNNCTKLITDTYPYTGTLFTNSGSTGYSYFMSAGGINTFYLNVLGIFTIAEIVDRIPTDIGDITAVINTFYPQTTKTLGADTLVTYKKVGACSTGGYIYTSNQFVSSVTSTSFYNGMNHLLGLFLSNNVTDISANACQGAYNLKTIQIPNSVISINSTAFTGCTILKPDPTTLVAPYPGTIYTSTPPTEYISNFFNSYGFYLNFSPLLCFKEGSKILYYNSETNQEQYIEIEKLKRGDLVKTLLHGYKKIEHIGNSKMYNNVNDIRSVDKLYKCSKTEYPELFEDLIITGAHSILVNDFKDNEKEKTLELLSDIYVTDKKYRLPACIDKRAQIYEVEGQHTIWHFSLEHENYYMNYGVFANGLLVETASNRMMVECSGLNIA